MSGKEGELDDERAIIIEIINSFGFTPVSSEKRPASSDPIEEEYLGEVSTSDIYIGLFGAADSPATINEFDTARAHSVCTLVFEKNLPEGIDRKPNVSSFLQKIKNPQSGLVVPKYDNVIDLRKKIIHALSAYLTKKFKEAKKLQRDESKIANDEIHELFMKKLADLTAPFKEDSTEQTRILAEKLQYSFGVQFSEQFGKVEFLNFEFPSELKSGTSYHISAKITGSTTNGFLDLALRDPDGIYYWFPDPLSYDSALDNGKLTFVDKEHSATWEYSIPNKTGLYIAIMALYENNFENRRCVNYEKKEFIVS